MRTPKLTRYLRSKDEELIIAAAQDLISGALSPSRVEKHFGHLLDGAQGLIPGTSLRHFLGDDIPLKLAQVVTLAILSATGQLTQRKSLTLHAHTRLLELNELELPAVEKLTVWQLEVEHLDPLLRFIQRAPKLKRINVDATINAELFGEIARRPTLYNLMGGPRLTLHALRDEASRLEIARHILSSAEPTRVWERVFKQLLMGIEDLKPGQKLRAHLSSYGKKIASAEPVTLAILQATGRLSRKRKLTARATPELLSLTPNLPALKTLNLIGLESSEVESLIVFISGAPKLERLELDRIDHGLYEALSADQRLIKLLGNITSQHVDARQEEQVTEESLTALFTSRCGEYINQAVELGLMLPGDQVGARFSFAELLRDSRASTLTPGSRLRLWLSDREPQLPDGSRVSADLAQVVLFVLMRLSGQLKRLPRLRLSANPLFVEFEIFTMLEDELLAIPQLELSTWSAELLVSLQHTPRLLEKLIRDNQYKARELKSLKPHLERFAHDALESESMSGRRRTQLTRLAKFALGEAVTDVSEAPISWRLCPAGVFTMGSPAPAQREEPTPKSDWEEWLRPSFKLRQPEKHPTPQHVVEISRPLLVSQTMITERQWDAVMGSQVHQQSSASLPMLCSFRQAATFCNRLSELHNLTPAYDLSHEWEVSRDQSADGYRLLSEAEWEHIARAGERFDYAGSSTANHVGWASHNSRGRLHPVAQKSPNAWGLYDLSGNCEEWCDDAWVEGVYDQRIETLKQSEDTHLVDPIALNFGALERVTRGGSRFAPSYCGQVSARQSRNPRSSRYTALRVARAL